MDDNIENIEENHYEQHLSLLILRYLRDYNNGNKKHIKPDWVSLNRLYENLEEPDISLIRKVLNGIASDHGISVCNSRGNYTALMVSDSNKLDARINELEEIFK